MEKNQNFVELSGQALSVPILSHENHGEQFYKFPLRVARLSGQYDIPTITVNANLLDNCPVLPDTSLYLRGQLRSYNNKSGQGSRLILSVFAQDLLLKEGAALNHVSLTGVLCKPPILRKTPLGRSICDIILAVNRRYGRADYLPCIAWGQVASQIAVLSVGTQIAIDGRIQSRTYTKVLESGTEERTAFEVSIMRLLSVEE